MLTQKNEEFHFRLVQDTTPQLPQFLLQKMHGGTVRTGNKRLWRSDRKIQKRGTHGATL